mgnify:CR=1 FL=1
MREQLNFYINGKWVAPAAPRTHEVINPATEKPAGRISLGSAGDVDKAVKAARKAFETWSQTSIDERKALLDKIIAIYQRRLPEMAETISSEMGAPMPLAQSSQAPAGLGYLIDARKQLDSFKFEYDQNGARILREPIGVVGMITPWNWPMNQVCAKVGPALAAGCTMVLKPSELAPLNAVLFAEIMDEAGVPAGVFNLVNGDGPSVGAALAAHPDIAMMSFTGSTRAGTSVMQACAERIKRVALELGGKSPVVIGRSADIAKTAARVMAGKTMNAGQVCLAPDFVLAPKEQLEPFVSAATEAVAKMFPAIKSNPDYTSMINQRHFERVRGLIEDARAKGARVIELNPAREDFSQQEHRRIPPTLILDATDEMGVMQEEIFGPVLPVKTYISFEETIADINARPRPLALYYFGDDSAESGALLERTHSGGVTLNDVLFHFSMEDLPFGGVGPSGMGAYHGHRGFLEFSHEKAVYRQTPSELIAMFRPPYGEAFRKQVAARLKP